MPASEPPIILDIFTDVVGYWLGVPTGTAAAVVRRYRGRKASQLRELWLEELRQGRAPLQAADEDEAAEICIRLLRCAEEGTARINLRLLLRILRGLSERGPVYASDFARFQRMFADLTREEIIFVATLYREWNEAEHSTDSRITSTWEKVDQALVPVTFKSRDHALATGYSALRSGLVMPDDTWDGSGLVKPSPLMDEVAELASLEEALAAESSQQ